MKVLPFRVVSGKHMAKILRIQEAAEGFIAYCHGSAKAFSFLIGKRQPSVTKVSDERYLFATEASHAPYLLQFGWPDLTDDVASWGKERDLEILATHCKWEMD